jgi:rRNA processing protein Krr1/Pno1
LKIGKNKRFIVISIKMKIGKNRIAVLIGKDGEIKKEIESKLGVKINL